MNSVGGAMDTNQGVKGKTAIITGAGRGIGRAIAKRLAAGGANVAIISRTIEQLDETKRIIESSGGRVLPLPGDVSKADQVEELVTKTVEHFGGVDVLVNNAGTAPLATIDQMEPEVFDRIISTNVRTVYLCSRAVWPHMADGDGGVIINISSIAAYDPFPGFAAYGAAKAFVVTYTKALATEGKSCGIRVYGIAPGTVDTQMLRGAFPDYPLEKALPPDAIAAFAEVLLSPACQYIAGQTISIKKN